MLYILFPVPCPSSICAEIAHWHPTGTKSLHIKALLNPEICEVWGHTFQGELLSLITLVGIVGQGTGWTGSWFADHVIWGSSCPLLLPDRMISFYLLLASPWYNHSAQFLVFTLLISGHFLATSLSSSFVDSVIQSTWSQFQCGISANIKFNQPSHLGIYWLDPYLRRYFCNTWHKASLPVWW